MTGKFRRKKMRLPLRLWVHRFFGSVFVVLLLVLIPVVLQFQMGQTNVRRFSGLVDTESETVGPTRTARILSVEVCPGQVVKPGDVLVRLVPSNRALDLAMDELRLRNYERDILRCEQNTMRQKQNLEDSERRCRKAVQEAAVALEMEKMNRVRDEAELAGLKEEISRLQPLVDRRLVSETELSSLRPKVLALEKIVTQYESLISALENQYTHAFADLEEIRGLLAAQNEQRPQSDPALASMQQAAELCRQAAATDPAVLRASRAGVVSRVMRQDGDVVTAGEPVVRVTVSGSRRIIGMLTQSQFDELAVGDTVRATRAVAGTSGKWLAEVDSVDPEIMDLLDPLNPTPRFPVRGRRVWLRLLGENQLLVPGEAVLLEPEAQEMPFSKKIQRLCSFFSTEENAGPDNSPQKVQSDL